MRHMLTRSTLLAVAFTALSPGVAAAAPSVTAVDAAKIAQDHLKERGLAGQYHITSVALEAEDVRRSAYRWTVRWSDPITLTSEKKELGLEITMDGKIVRVVRGAANKDPLTGEFDPNGPRGLKNHRTRSDRPSVLSLKH
jgi:hypothetical protein